MTFSLAFDCPVSYEENIFFHQFLLTYLKKPVGASPINKCPPLLSFHTSHFEITKALSPSIFLKLLANSSLSLSLFLSSASRHSL